MDLPELCSTGSAMSGADEKMRAVLERVARELWLTPGIDSEVESEWVPLVSGYLKGRLLPLLLAGQAMRDAGQIPATISVEELTDEDAHPLFKSLAVWDVALAAAQGQPEKESGR